MGYELLKKINQKNHKNRDEDDYYRDERRHTISNDYRCQNCGNPKLNHEDDVWGCDDCGYRFEGR